MSPELKSKLKQVLAGKGAVDMGQFRFLNLDRVREQAGADWGRLREKIYETGNHFIEKRIAPEDAVIRCRGGFMIVFAAVDPEAAEAHVRAIEAEMERFFLGEQRLAAIGIDAEARNVTTEELLEIVAQTQDEQPRRRAAGKAADLVVGERSPEWGSQRFAPDVPCDEVVFRPVWDSRRGVLVCNLATACRDENGVVYLGRDVLMGRDEPDLHLGLDLAVVRAAHQGFRKAHASAGPTVIVMPVRYSTLAVASRRMEYIAALRSMPDAVRRYFCLRVDGVPDGAPIGGMQEVFRSMRPFGAQLLVKLGSGTTDLRRFEGCAVGVFDADGRPASATRTPARRSWRALRTGWPMRRR